MQVVALIAFHVSLVQSAWHANLFETSRMMQAFTQIKDYENEFGSEMNVPSIVVIGVESAGKSTLLSAIVGVPLTFTQGNTGTRCPVRYRLRYGEDAKDPEVKVMGQVIPPEKLPEKVQLHMESLAGTFRADTFDVEITSRLENSMDEHVPDLEMIDMPGIIAHPNPKDPAEIAQAEEVERIQAKFVRNRNMAIVAVVKCTERFKTIADFKFLDDVATKEGLVDLPPRREWRSQVLIVANRLNQQVDTWSMQVANSYFAEAREQGNTYKGIFFVALRPPVAGVVDPDAAPYDQKKAYYEKLEVVEHQWLQGLKQAMSNKSSGVPWNPANDGMFGLANVKDSIVNTWREGFLAKLPSLSSKIEKERQHSKQRMHELEEKLRMVDLKLLRQKMKDFLADFVHRYQALATGQAVKDLQGRDVTSFKLSRMHIYDPARYGKTFEEEMKMTPIDKSRCGWLLTWEELLSDQRLGAQDQHLGEKLSMQYLGMASYERSLKIMEYMMIARNFDHVSDDNIRIMARGHSKYGTGAFPSNEVVLQIASDQVHQLNGGVEWYTDFLQANFVDYMNPVMEYMSHSTQYGMVTSSDKFMLKLRQHFEGVVARRISGVVEMYGNDVRRYTRFRAIDVITKLHMASAMLPMEKIIPTEAMLLPEPAMATKVSTQSSVRTQGEYVMPVNSPRQKKVVAERELKKLEAIRSMSTCQCHDPKLFNIGDFVQGGYAQVYPMEWSMIDFDYLRNTAYQYYVRIAMILSELLRATLHSEFLDNLLDTSEKTLMKDILNIESEIQEEELKEMEKAEETDVEAKAKRPRTDGAGAPPLFSNGGYTEAADGWWAHSGGEWLHNKKEMAYFHLPTGQLRVVLDDAEEDEGPLLRGKVRWFNAKKGFGFIEPLDEAANVLEKDLFAEELVTFRLGQTDDGRMCAVGVKTAEAGDADAPEETQEQAEENGEVDGSEASSVEIDLEEELKCGFHQDKAEGKETCEDFLVDKVKLPINVLGETASFVFFGVFDGHGGPYCAEHVSTHLGKNILARLRDRARNVSDEVVSSSKDHKPNLPAEKKRIEAADGGVVEVQGVWRCVLPQKKRLTSKIAGLAVSRSFGDKDFKGPDIVSAEPEITVHEVDWDADEFVILATDGIWDVLTDKDSVALVRHHLLTGQTEQQAAEALVKRAREKGSQDDCTAMVVRFAWASKGEAVEPEVVQNTDKAAAFACGFARVLEKLVLGTASVQEAIALATKELMDPERAFKTTLDDQVAKTLERVVGELAGLSHSDAGMKLKPEAVSFPFAGLA
eukprot:g11224.t1